MNGPRIYYHKTMTLYKWRDDLWARRPLTRTVPLPSSWPRGGTRTARTLLMDRLSSLRVLDGQMDRCKCGGIYAKQGRDPNRENNPKSWDLATTCAGQQITRNYIICHRHVREWAS